MTKYKRIIYETSGKAKEYADLGVNAYLGCEHQCDYCFVKKMAGRQPAVARPRKDILENLERQILAGDPKPDGRVVNLSFLSDPYPKIEAALGLTRRVIMMLGQAGYRISILTKAGYSALRDFDLYKKYNAIFGQTIITLDEKRRDKWEPSAPPIFKRLHTFQFAKDAGISTWCSVEPVIRPQDALEVIERVKDLVDEVRIGKLNYHPHLVEGVDWKKFTLEAARILQGAKCKVLFKKSLAAYLPRPLAAVVKGLFTDGQ